MRLIRDADLSEFNTLRLPARAAVLAEVEHWYELERILDDPELAALPWLVLGEGSNILFREDFCGLVLRIANQGIHVLEESGDDVFVRAAAGENWHGLVQWTAAQGYWGIENLSLIPGTVGAAPVQNIGAYGVELDERIVSVRAHDRLDRQWHDFDRQQCEFGYRDSRFKRDTQERYCITEIVLRLSRRGEPHLEYPGLRDAVEAAGLTDPCPAEMVRIVADIRQSKLPDPERIPNVGSFFKNPIIDPERASALAGDHENLPSWEMPSGVKLSAAWLIDQCGYKGKRRGEAGVYENHALVLINHGGATGRDLWDLALEIQEAVYERFGVRLEPEPLIV